MWALPLLLLSALFSVTVAGKAEVQQWTETVRQAADRYVRKNIWAPYTMDQDPQLNALQSQIPNDVDFTWVHKDKKDGRVYWCGGPGGLRSLKWVIGYMAQSHGIQQIDRGQASGDDIAVWNVKTAKDTRKARIQGQFNGDKLVRYLVIYDHESPLV